MPVLYNTTSGLAENVPDEQAQDVLGSGSHEVFLNDPDGNPVSVPFETAQGLLYSNKGYSQPSQNQLNYLLKASKYQTPGERVKGALEAVGSGVVPFGGSTLIERMSGVPAEDIRNRREFSLGPGERMGAEAVGLVASPLSEAIGAIGKGAQELTGLGGEGAGLISKLGGSAVKVGAETSALAAGDEASKFFSEDPNQTAQTALTNVGLSGLLGAGIGVPFGGVSAAWDALADSKLGNAIKAIQAKSAGPEEKAAPNAIDEALKASGLAEVPAEVRAAIAGEPEVQKMFQTLMESSTSSGAAVQDAMKAFRQKVHAAVLDTFGMDEGRLGALADASEHDAGKVFADSLKSEIEEVTSPLSKRFEDIKDKYAEVPLDTKTKDSLGSRVMDFFENLKQRFLGKEPEPGTIRDEIADKVMQFAKEHNYTFSGTPESALINNLVTKWLPEAKDLKGLTGVYSLVGRQAERDQAYHLGAGLQKIIRDFEDKLVLDKLAEKDPELAAKHLQARKEYAAEMNDIDALNDRLHVGKYRGVKTFLNNLAEMKPEDIARRISGKNDAGLLELLTRRYPKTAALVREYAINKALKTSAMRAKGDLPLNLPHLFGAIDGWSPEFRQFAITPEQAARLKSIRALLAAIPEKMNTSGTAKTLDALLSKWPSGMLSMVSMLTGHNPIAGFVLGELGRFAGREAPDAVKLATLRMLGSEVPLSSKGFKSAVDFASAFLNGDTFVTKAAKAVFRADLDVLPKNLIPSAETREKLDEKLQEIQLHPDKLMQVGGEAGHYMPEHQSALASTAAKAVNYLNAERPSAPKLGPLDKPGVVSEFAKSEYNKTLDIAEQPLLAVQKIKDGTLTPKDVVTVKTLYPGLYNKLAQRLTNEMIAHVSNGNEIPYQTRLSLSLFLGQPLDGTMTPQAIIAAQPKGPAPIPQAPTGKARAGSMQKIGKGVQGYMTPGQASAASHVNKQ